MQSTRVGFVGLGLLLAACSAGASSGTFASEVNAEEAPKAIEGHLASCTVASANVITVSCTNLSASLPTKFLLDVTLTGADGKSASFNLWNQAEGSARLLPSFPITLAVKASRKADSHDAQVLVPMELTQTLTVAAATTAPLDIRLPYDFWPVTVSTSTYALMQSTARPVAVAPWTSNGSAADVPVEEQQAPVRADAPAKAILIAPVGAKTIPVSFTLKDETVINGAFDGPGAFVIGATGLARAGNAPTNSGTPGMPAAEPTSFGDVAESFLACHAGPASVDGQPVSCSLRDVAGTKVSFASARLKDATGHTSDTVMLAAGDTMIGHCVAAPCTLDGSVQLEAAGQSLGGDLELTIGSEPATLRLPYDQFPVSIDAGGLDPLKGRVVELQVGANATVPAGTGWKQAMNLGPLRLRGSATDATLLVPIGTRSVPVHVVGIDLLAKKKVETDGSIEHGKKYTVTSAFNVAATP